MAQPPRITPFDRRPLVQHRHGCNCGARHVK
jgi:hypothetical protein